MTLLALYEVESLGVELILKFVENRGINNAFDLVVWNRFFAVFAGTQHFSFLLHIVIPNIVSEAIVANGVQAFLEIGKSLEIIGFHRTFAIGLCTLNSFALC